MSALAACQPTGLQSCNSLQQDAPGQPLMMESAMAELCTLRAEMAALQAALTILKGIKICGNQELR